MEDFKKKALESAIQNIEKQFGKGSVMIVGETEIPAMAHISSGCLSIDNALGIGGYPKGRIVEIYGPESGGKTTLALHAVANAQKAGGIAAFIDAEHALDVKYAEALGVNVKELVISQPDTGEQALEIAESLIRSGVIDIIVIDSVAALVPRAEIEGDMGDAHVGLQARLMSQALRKLTGALNKTNCTAIFINQLREKIGVMYGCLHGDTLVNFTDGRSIPIKDVVAKEIKGSVYSLNEATGMIEEKEIIDWHYNGDVKDKEDFIHIETDSINQKNGIFGFTVTPDHKIMTKTGWKEAKNLTLNDKVMSKYKSILNGTLADFIYGTTCGDCHISIRNKNTATIRFQDSKNNEYIEWKISKLSPFISFKKIQYNDKVKYETKYNYEFSKLKREIGNRNPMVFLEKHYSDLGLAIWVMDDGCYSNDNYHNRLIISVKRFKNDIETLNSISSKLLELGFENKVNYKNGNITFTTKASDEIFERIAKFVPDCMQYKLPDKYKGKYEDFSLSCTEKLLTDYVDVKKIRFASDKQMKNKKKFDISIADNHNYMVGGVENGIIVHNSPETTAGGRALKFYASIRIDVRKIETIKKGSEVVGNRTRAKIVKNKVAPPFKEAEFEIVYGKGISYEADLIEMALKKDIIQKGGAWYNYGERRWHGKEDLKNELMEDKEFAQEIADKIKS